MKKLLLLMLTTNGVLRDPFIRFIFLTIALTLSTTASAIQYCDHSITSGTSTVLVSFESPSANSYKITIKSSVVMTGIHAGWYIGTSGGNIQALSNYASSNGGKTFTVTFNSTTTPNMYTNIHILYPGLIQYTIPASITWGTCTALPSPTFGTFTVPAKVVGDADFTITPPTSNNSTGAFTYTSSNTNVATIVSGNQIRVIGFTGTSTITANQAATASYSAGSTTATLTVTSPNPAPTLGTFTIAPMFTNAANFTITAPTTNSSGAFSYTSSDPAVATIINGNQIDVLTAGTVTITAIQSYDANFKAGSTTASLVVSVPSPTVAATTPTVPSGNVISIYSNAYTPTAGVALNPNWGQSGLATANTTTYQVASNNTLYYPNMNYQGTSFTAINLSSYKSVHLDVWTPNITNLKFALVPVTGAEKFIIVAVTPYSWNSIDILLSQYTSQNSTILNSVKEIKYENANSAGTMQTGGTLYVDNVYFDKSTTWKGTTSTNWATTTNWSTGAAPTATSDVVIATVTHQPIIGSNVSINSLAITTGSSLTVNSEFNLTVANAVTNSGTMTLQNNANLIQGGTTNTNSGNIIVNRNSASIQLYDYTLWSSPVAGQKLKAFSPDTLNARFYSYNSGTNLYNVVLEPLTTDFTRATGYLIRVPNDWAANTQRTFNGVFTGIPNNGTVPINLSYTDADRSYNLVGNPYPSTIDANAFITENTLNIESTLYFWRKTNGASGSAYATYNPAGGTFTAPTATSGTPNGTIQVGQGFFVKAKSASTLNFKNAMRLTSTSTQFFRTNTERNRIWLNLTNTSGVFSQMLVSYMAEATQGVDSLDGKYINDAPIALTSIINAEEYTIQGRALPFSTTDTVPLGFKTNAAGNYTIAIDHVDGLFSIGQAIFLKDNLLNTVVDLNAGSYSFASAIGTFNSRFEVVYQSTLAVTNPTFTANSVIAFGENGEIKINSGSTIMELVRVYDLQGRLLVEKKQINASETKVTTPASNQVLLVEITAANGSKITKKIIQ